MATTQETIEQFKQTLNSVAIIKDLSVETKLEILDMYEIMGTAYHRKNFEEGEQALQKIKNNTYTFNILSSKLIYLTFIAESLQDYYNITFRNKSAYGIAMLTAEANAQRVIDSLPINQAEIISLEDIEKALASFEVEQVDDLSEEELRRAEEDAKAAEELENSGWSGFDDDEDINRVLQEVNSEEDNEDNEDWQSTEGNNEDWQSTDNTDGEDKQTDESDDTDADTESDITSSVNKELRKKYENAFGGRIDGPIDSMLATLDNLYRSGFESMPQVGILINNQSNPLVFLNSSGNETVKNDRNTAIDFAIFDVLSKLNPEFAYIAETESGKYKNNVIPKLESLVNQKCVCYKLHLQFQTANINACSGDTSIRKWIVETQLKNGKYASADDWLQKCNFGKTHKLQKFSDVLKWYKWCLENIIYNMLMKQGIKPEASNQVEAMNAVDILFKSLRNVIVVADRKKKGDSEKAVETEIRISTDSILDGEKVAEALSKNLNIGNSTDIEVRTTRYSNGVMTLNIIFDKKESNKANLFASEVLDNILESGNAPSWNHALLGKNVDGSYLFWDDFMDPGKAQPYKRCYTIYAASRSGKGVMTSTLVASALCDDKQIFYTDGKPENGACLGEIAWSCGKEAYVFNGTPEGAVPYSGEMEAYTNGQRDVGEIYRFATSLPKKLFESSHFTKNDQRKFLGVMRYLKSMMLCSEVILGRAKGTIPKEKWQVWIFDEMTKMSSNEKDIRKKFLQYAGDKVKVKKVSDSNKVEYLTSIVNDEKLKKALDKNSETYDEGIEYIYKWLNWCSYIVNNMHSAAVIELGKADMNLIFIFQQASWIPEDCTITTIGAVVDDLDSTKIVGNGGIQPLCKDYGDGTTKGPWVDKINSGTGWWAISNDANIRNGNVKLFKPFNVFTTKLAPDGTKSKAGFESEEEKLHYMDGYARKLLSSFGKCPEDILNEAFIYAQSVVTSLQLGNTLKDFIYDGSNLTTGNSDNRLEDVGNDENGNRIIINESGITSSVDIREDSEDNLDLGTTSESRFTPVGNAKGVSQSAQDDMNNALAKKPIQNGIMPYAKFVTLDNRSQNAVIDRALKEVSSKRFNTYGNGLGGLKHLCWNISILHAVHMIDSRRIHPSIADFVTNYCINLDNGTYQYDYIPKTEEVNALNVRKDGTFNNNGSVIASPTFYSNTSSDTVTEEEFDNFTDDFANERTSYDGSTMQEPPRDKTAFSQNPAGRNNVDPSELRVPPIRLDDTNSIDIDPSEGKIKFMQMLSRSMNGASYLCTQRTKSVVDAIIKAMKDKNIVKRVSIREKCLVVNGRFVDTDPLINDEYGIRFEDFVIVKEILKTFKNIESLVLDNDMFNQVVMDYGDDAQSLWAIFQQNPKLLKMEVQYAPGSEFTTITRRDFTNQAAKIQSEAKKSKLKQQIETVSASHNPRLAEKGIGYAKSSFDIASSMGSNFKKQLTKSNPNLFKAGLYGAVAGVFGIAGVAIGLPSSLFKMFKR